MEDFQKFPSIPGSHTKSAKYIVEYGLDRGEWVATLKIHGANYSLWTDGKKTLAAQRKSFLSNNDTSFYGDNTERFKEYHERAKSMHSYFKFKGTLVLYGEIFGGSYPHPEVERNPKATRVQTEVFYTTENDFIVFDIAIIFDDGDRIFLSWDKMKELCYMFGFMYVPELARGTFQEMMEFDPVFPDPIYKRWDLPEIEGNYAEGIVIKPVSPKYFADGDRVALKKKNPKFAEVKQRKVKVTKSVEPPSECAEVTADELMAYVTKARLVNVVSHIGIENIEKKDFRKLLDAFVLDIQEDYSYDTKEGAQCELKTKKERDFVERQLRHAASRLIGRNFLDIINNDL